ncbi:MAG: pyridoxamine 5'-phosphate oxidase family protein [Deltaproteobacteria bacterium]|nr:pyridoxamine 5'-phosphate oxidase family protein [Deltaproteobacteria bacterium]
MTTTTDNSKLAEISLKLKGTPYCAMSTLSGTGDINARFMLFANTASFDWFYLMTGKSTAKVGDLRRRPEIALAAMTLAADIQDYRETLIKGRATILETFSDKAVQNALELLAEKMPMVQGLLDSGSLGDYVIIAVKTLELKYRLYSEILEQKPPTVITFG